jgi:DNA-binding MarR family transcriptional regulator
MTEYQHDLIAAALQAQESLTGALRSAADPAWLELDLTMAQLKALVVLADDAGLTVGGLADRLGLGKPAASILVERLVQLELVTRTEDTGYRRRTLVRLTESGAALISRLRQGSQERLRGWLSLLAVDDLAALVQGLQALARIAGASREQSAMPV